MEDVTTPPNRGHRKSFMRPGLAVSGFEVSVVRRALIAEPLGVCRRPQPTHNDTCPTSIKAAATPEGKARGVIW